jgi:spore germination protein YaaH
VAEKPIGQRVDRLEQVVQIIAEDQVSLQKLIAELARETRKGFDRVAKQFEETDKKMREMMLETDRRFRQTDERIDKLVVAIG